MLERSTTVEPGFRRRTVKIVVLERADFVVTIGEPRQVPRQVVDRVWNQDARSQLVWKHPGQSKDDVDSTRT